MENRKSFLSVSTFAFMNDINVVINAVLCDELKLYAREQGAFALQGDIDDAIQGSSPKPIRKNLKYKEYAGFLELPDYGAKKIAIKHDKNQDYVNHEYVFNGVEHIRGEFFYNPEFRESENDVFHRLPLALCLNDLFVDEERLNELLGLGLKVENNVPQLTRERNTLLKIIKALASEAHIEIKQHEAAGAAIEVIGDSLGIDGFPRAGTIASKLKEVKSIE